MAIDFKATNIFHRIIAKFYPATLPNAKKKYIARTVFQQHLDIHGIASKASLYNVTTSPKIIEEGMNAGFEIMYYLIGEGYKIDTPVAHFGISVPGEYDGYETQLPQGIHPTVLIRVSNELNKYIKDNVLIIFDGKEESKGLIATIIDEVTKEVDSVITINNLVSICGIGLKIESDATHVDQVGLFFVNNEGVETPASIIAVNEPKKVKAIVPPTLVAGKNYYIKIRTQSSVKSGAMLKDVREVVSDFAVTAQVNPQVNPQ